METQRTRVIVPYKINEAWQTLFFGKSQKEIADYINSVWFAGLPYEITLQKKSVVNPNQLYFIFEEPKDRA